MEPVLARAAVRRFERPRDVVEAHRLLGEVEGARLAGGGTDLVLHPPAGLTTLVDLSRLPLSYVEQRGGAVAIGATTTLAEMGDAPALATLAQGVLPLVLAQLGSPALRNVATLGGHLARGRLSDLVPVLLVLDAEVRLFDGEERTMPLADCFASAWHRRPVVLTEVLLSAASATLAAAFAKFSRAAFDHAVLNVACSVDLADGRVARARVAVGETPRLASRVAPVEELLVGRPLDDDTLAGAADLARRSVPTGDDERGSAAYRTHLVGVGVRRCLRSAAGRPELVP